MQFRRPAGVSGSTPSLPFFRTIAGRRSIKQAAIVLGAFIIGYLITVFWIFPAPFFSSRHSVPRVIDLGVTEARGKLESAGLRFKLGDQETDPVVPKNAVVRQDPPPGVIVDTNTVVTLTLSDGPPDVPVPDLAGFPRALAERVIKAAGFKVGRVDTLPSASERGIVVQTRPGPGVGRSAGTPIELVVSSGKADATVPNLIGLTVADARARLGEIGLVVGSVTSRTVAGGVEGTILEQRPDPGVRSGRGTRVDLIVAGRN